MSIFSATCTTCLKCITDQVDQAVGDMNTGLQLKELLLDPSDRRLAEA